MRAPRWSSGRVNPDTGLPEEETTEVETNVSLQDGQGFVIGGLIKEKDSNVQKKVPLFGDLWMIGLRFRQLVNQKHRTASIAVFGLGSSVLQSLQITRTSRWAMIA